MTVTRQSGREYVMARSQPIPYVGCWLWLQSCGSHGYGNAFWPTNRATVAHRVAFEAFVGDIPQGMLVQHSCDNRWCVNPDHLSLGTDATNADDKRRKGRAVKKVPTEARVKICEKYKSGKWTQRALASRYGVNQRSIWQIIQRGC